MLPGLDGYGLLVGHMLGDYILQNDWMARNKSNPYPGKEPHPNLPWIGYGPAPKQDYPGPYSVDADPSDKEAFRAALEERNRKIDEWDAAEEARIKAYMEKFNSPERVEQRAWIQADEDWRFGHVSCTVHCLFYTLAVWVCSLWWMPWWGLVVCFVVHWPIDRFRLAEWWMTNVSGQKEFATGSLAPWSVIVVDNTFHLLTLFLIALAV